ncbi:MAG TPA: hypothetical protein O0X50_04220 [Methanocorpusculum sp.]|nr:hypothetical protein [Methanocorpusculum sp.]
MLLVFPPRGRDFFIVMLFPQHEIRCNLPRIFRLIFSERQTFRNQQVATVQHEWIRATDIRTVRIDSTAILGKELAVAIRAAPKNPRKRKPFTLFLEPFWIRFYNLVPRFSGPFHDPFDFRRRHNHFIVRTAATCTATGTDEPCTFQFSDKFILIHTCE